MDNIPPSSATDAKDTATARTGRRYLALVFAGIALLLGATAAVNAVVDPYLQRWPRPLPWIDPDFRGYDREIRLNLVTHVRPEVLLLGNSRAQQGLDPSHPAFAGRRALNGSIVGGRPPRLAEILERAEQQGHVDLTILGLDYIMMFGDQDTPTNDAMVVGPGVRGWINRVKTLISYSTLASSLSTTARALVQKSNDLSPDGRILESLYDRDMIGKGGARRSILFRDAESIRTFRYGTGHFFQGLDRLLEIACTNRTRLILFLSPVHARHLEIIEHTGHWARFEDWKRRVAALAWQRPACPVAVWDFADFNEIATEPVPAFDSPAALRWFWESSHYKKETGDLILDRLFGRSHQGVDVARFGALLDPETLEAHLADVRAGRDEYHRLHPAESAEIAELVRTVLAAP